MRKRQSGFTLIELVIVIILLGIIGATITPKFVDIQSNARQAVVDAATGAVQSSALIGFAGLNGQPSTFAAVIGSTDGVAPLGGPVGAGDSTQVSVNATCTAGTTADLAFTIEHIDDTGITSAGIISDAFCIP